MRPRRQTAHAPLLTLALVLAVTAMAAADTEVLPEAVTTALAASDPGWIARVHWSAARTHPVMVNAVAMEEQLGARAGGPARLILEMMSGQVEELGLEPRVVEEVWWLGGVGPSSTWLRSGVSDSALEMALEAAGWSADPSREDRLVWARGADPELTEWQEELLAEIEDPDERAEMLAMIETSTPRIVRCPDGWLTIARPYSDLEGAATAATVCGELRSLEEPPEFPAVVLLGDSRSALARVAIRMPGRGPGDEDGAQDTDQPSEREQVLERLRSLHSSEDDLFAQLGDMSIVVSELDGGLAVDVQARHPDGRGPDETERFVRMLLLGLRFVTAPVAPELDRELAGTIIQSERSTVRASCTISQGALLQAMERHAARQREIDELMRRLEELDSSSE